jgi:tryptophan-rich sensory protein
MKISNPIKLIISLVICQLAGIIGSLFTMSKIPTWYMTISKPELAPPNWIFGPVWTTLFILMSIALYLVWKQGTNRKDVKIALYIFGTQLILNVLWSIIFFGLENPGSAFVEIISLWISILLSIIYFYKISKPASYLLIPYITWVSFASYLNFMIWWLN